MDSRIESLDRIKNNPKLVAETFSYLQNGQVITKIRYFIPLSDTIRFPPRYSLMGTVGLDLEYVSL